MHILHQSSNLQAGLPAFLGPGNEAGHLPLQLQHCRPVVPGKHQQLRRVAGRSAQSYRQINAYPSLQMLLHCLQ